MEFIDYLYKDVAKFVITKQTISTSTIQREFKVGYNRARRLLDFLETIGIVGSVQNGLRQIYVNDETQLDNILNKSDDLNKSENSFVLLSQNDFIRIATSIRNLKDCIILMNKESKIQNIFEKTNKDIYKTLQLYLIKDIITIYKELGYKYTMDTLEGQCLFIVLIMFNNKPIDYEVLQTIVTTDTDQVKKLKENTFNSIQSIDNNINIGENGYNIVNIVDYNQELQKTYLKLLYRFMSDVIYINNEVSDKEISWLNNLSLKITKDN